VNYKPSHPRRQPIHDNSDRRVVVNIDGENFVNEVRFDEISRNEALHNRVGKCEPYYKGFAISYRWKVKADNGTNVSRTFCLHVLNISSIIQIEFPFPAWGQCHTVSGVGFPDLESKAAETGGGQHD